MHKYAQVFGITITIIRQRRLTGRGPGVSHVVCIGFALLAAIDLRSMRDFPTITARRATELNALLACAYQMHVFRIDLFNHIS